MIALYSYWRSSAAYRVRIALGLKQLDYEIVPVHLVRGGGEQHQPGYRALNPQGRVPTLVHDGEVLTQSLAIIEYLDESWPEPPLLPPDPAGRARCRSLAQLVASDIHPLNNLGVLNYLKNDLSVDEDALSRWYQHWVGTGFAALERRLESEGETGQFCHGDRPTLADLCLVPQVYNARRFEVDLSDFPVIVAIDAACSQLGAFSRAAPEAQPDAS